jgi:16S rRNA (adenine1518-N6/adenine1519-N6)-dimethyltransferase
MDLKIYSQREVVQILSNHKIILKKSLGQNLLIDLESCKKITCTPLKDEIVIEIGPGIGNLTQAILANGPKQLIAVEKDSSFEPILSKIQKSNSSLKLVYLDALRVDISELSAQPVHIFGNLPYNIATQLIFKWIKDISIIKSLTLTLQSEVTNRICAGPGTKDYGKLGILCQLFFECSKVCELGPELFYPIPKVSSATVYMRPKTNVPNEKLYQAIRTLTSVAFSQRRKMLRQSLKTAFKSPEEVCKSLSIDSMIRAEDVTILQYVQLAQHLIDSA